MDPSTPLTESSAPEESGPLPEVVGANRVRPSLDQRIVALIEVVLCSDFPTQALVALTMLWLGFPTSDTSGSLNVGYLATLLMADTVLLVGLILLLLRSHGERPATVFFGATRWWTELMAAPAMVGIAYGIALTVMLGIAALVPWLHTVEKNPLQNLLLVPRDATIFAFLVIVAGGVREEVQRAFILTRFEQSLGGPVVGVVVSSIAFGAGHFVQGADAALATGLLGAFWGVVYLRRRSIVAPVVSHAAFDLLQIGIFLISGR